MEKFEIAMASDCQCRDCRGKFETFIVDAISQKEAVSAAKMHNFIDIYNPHLWINFITN